jgi:hypothetical protein
MQFLTYVKNTFHLNYEDWLMLFKDIIPAYSEYHYKTINTRKRTETISVLISMLKQVLCIYIHEYICILIIVL